MTERELSTIVLRLREHVTKETSGLLARLAVAEEKAAKFDAIFERLVALETKHAAIPPPPDLTDVRERLVTLETKPAIDLDSHTKALDDVRQRVLMVDAKVAALPPAPDVTDLRERVAVLDTKFDTYADRVDVLAERPVGSPPAAQTPPAPSVTVDEVAQIRERVAVLEIKLGQPDNALPAIRDSVADLQNALESAGKDVQKYGERIAALEAKAAVPGPPGPPGRDGVDGKDGKDGADGVGFDELFVEKDGDRTLLVKAARGERVKMIGSVTFPVQINRGVYVQGASYEPGDIVTSGGSQWHCNQATTSRPGSGDKAWTLSVKCGRDGRDGKDAPSLPVVSVRA